MGTLTRTQLLRVERLSRTWKAPLAVKQNELPLGGAYAAKGAVQAALSEHRQTIMKSK